MHKLQIHPLKKDLNVLSKIIKSGRSYQLSEHAKSIFIILFFIIFSSQSVSAFSDRPASCRI